ncbi:hypothetical protein UCRNP2_3214 [Neofusicoccum parvum UCRNP2]|uniref:Uncharacterized protein n=1 Tax=Botryosphaeria parva (strain UCR-NP2) TaxID=1287680 RepID=R1EQH9_BOTPV|nr:hypothetical protein UCRNP2_3214 [Neofusicoccum parvum UCRNP2]
MYYQGLRLLQPREIPINSVTARTLPCGTISPPGLEKSTVLLTICSGYDVAEIKMFEAEIATNSGKGLDIDHGIYHETSTSNPNIWTVLFIREKPQLVPTGNVRGPDMPNEREALSNDKVDKMSRSRPGLGRKPLAPIYQPQRLSTKVNTTEGHWKVCYFDNQDIEVGNSDNDTVSVHEGQRLTCLRFYRGGKIPLLAGKGVDLTYWKTFCDYFSKGELQLEFLCPDRAEPIILSEEEQLRRRGKGKTNHAKANNNYRHTGASQTGHTANTPTPTGNIGVSLLPMAPALHLRTNSLPHFGSAVAYQVLPRSRSAGNNPYPYRQLPRRKVAVMHGWQAEMLSALGQERNPKWAGWTDRSPLYLERKNTTEKWEKQQIEWAVHSKDRARYILHAEPRACRDDGTIVADYFKGAERELNRVEKKVAAKFRSGGLNEEEERARLRQNEMLLGPYEHLRDVRATATKRAEARRRYRPDQRYQQTYMEAYHQQQQAYYYQQAYHQQHAWYHQQAYRQQQQHIIHQQQHQVYPQFAHPGLAFPSVSGSVVGQQGGQHVQAFLQNGQQGGN